MISAGNRIPEFTTVDDQHNPVTNKTLHGSWIVLYFYPKDETSGCTIEACSMRDGMPEFEHLGVAVYGISGDSVKSHQKFKANHSLPFPLLADTDHSMAIAFGNWVEKSMYGKKYTGMERSTVIVSPDGVIAAAYPKVSPADHARFLIAHLKELLAK